MIYQCIIQHIIAVFAPAFLDWTQIFFGKIDDSYLFFFFFLSQWDLYETEIYELYLTFYKISLCYDNDYDVN